MINTNTHILCEPYEIENYLNKNEIDVTTFTQKTLDLISSTKNSNYENISDIEKFDDSIRNNALSIDIPDNFHSFNINKIYQYSNIGEINKLISKLNEKTQKIFNLSNDIDVEEAEEYIEQIRNLVEDIRNGNVYNEKSFDTFGDLTTFKNIIDICNNSFYTSIIEWITSFPSKLVDIYIKNATKTINNKSYIIETKINSNKPSELKKEILYLIFILYEALVKNIIDTKLFWSSFLDMLDPETDVDNIEFVDDDSDINSILSDLDISEYENEDDTYYYGGESLDDPLFGLEYDNPIKTGNKKTNPFAKAFKTLKGLGPKINKIRKQFKMFRMRAKNHGFYMKYMGRIEGLYERYADEAIIIENGMLGDPVEILKEKGHEYISEVSNGFVNMQHELIDIAKKFASSANPKDMLNMLKNYGGMYMNDTAKSSSITSNFITSMRFKIGELILTHNKIYGYTTESIAENGKIPPSNHTIVSLFVDKPDEKPFEQHVSDIFKSPDSFKLIAKNEKEPIFVVSVICSNLLTKGIQEDSYKMLKQYRKESKEKFELMLKELTANAENQKKEKRNMTKQFKYCWKAILAGYDYLVSMKGYISDLIQSYFIMMTRIDNLCKECLVSLLHTETMHRDERYNTSHKADNIDSHKQYTQRDNEENVKTKGEQQLEKMQKTQETKAEYAERKQQVNEHINEIKKAMQMKIF